MNIQEFRKRYPQYDDLNDQQLATAIHQKFYSDLPQEQVFATLGFTPKPVAPAEPFSMSPEEMVDPEAALVLGAKPIAPTKPTPAPEKPEEPMGYDEALDDAVNYLQEGVPEAQVKRMFEGVEWEDISARARQRGMFVPKVLEEYTPEQVRERVKKYGELKGTPETDFAQDPAKWTAEAFTNVGKRTGANYRDVATSFLVQSGGIDPIDAALTLKENARRRSAAAPSLAIQEGMQEIGASETYGDAVSAMLKNPRATFTMVVDSVATSVPLVAPALVVAPAGFPAAAAAAFVGSAGLEYGSVMADVLQDKGVDLSDTLSIDKALRDPKIMNEIKEKGAKRGLIVGGFDAITMGLSGRFLRPVNELIEAAKLSGDAAKKAAIAAWGKEFAVQTGGGAAGEFLAQKATGEDRPADVLLEALAGGVTAPLEAMSALRGAREIEEGRAPPAPKAPTRIEPTLGPVAPVTPPVAAPVAPPVAPEPESAFAELTFDDEEAAAPTPPAPPVVITPPAPPAPPSVQPPAAPTAPPAPSQPPVVNPKASSDPTIREASKVLDITDRLEAREEQDIEEGMIYDENLSVSNAITKEDLDLFQEALRYATFIKENEEEFLAGDFKQMSDDVPSLIVNLFSGLEKRNLPYAREKLDYLRGATKDFISRTESYIKEFLPQPTQKPRLELVKTEPPKKERAPKQEKPAGEGPQPLLEEMEIDELEAQRRKLQRSPGQNLLATLRGRLSKEEADDIGTEFKMRTLRRAASKGSPDSLDDIVSNGELDEFLPYDMRSTVPTFDEKDSVEYIKDQIRDNNNLTYETQLALKELDFKIQEAYENLRLVDVNRELQAVAREEKELASEAEAAAIEAEERGAARDQAPPGEPAEGVGLDLRGQTPEELAELRRKEKSGEAEAERDRIEAERAAKAAAEAQRIIVEQKRESFELTPPPSAPAVQAAAPTGDLFGTVGITEQPTRAPRQVGAEPSPIEAAIEEEAKKDLTIDQEAVNEKPTEGDVLLIEADEKDFSRALKNAPTDDPILEELFNTKQAPAKPTATKFLSLKEASDVVDDWKKEAEQQGQTGINSDKTVISLFDASGQWSKPWVDAGFNVVTYDLQTGQDIQKFDAEMLLDEHGNDNVWAILAAPPCTDYASSGAQYWKSKDADGRTKISNELVQQVLRTVELLRPAVWAMENPVGRIAKVNNLPPAQLTFQPNLYGDPYTKKTLLWGNFNNKLPQAPVEPTEGSKIVKISSGNKYERSLTPEGFAYSFFAANNPVNMTQEERLSREFHGISPEEFKGAGTEEEIRDKIQDAYFDNDLDLVRELLKEKTPPGKLLFSIDMFADESSETSPPSIVPPKKLPPGRSRELAEAAAKVKSGEMSALEYDALVNKYKPIPVYDEPLRPASQSEVIDALDKSKKDKVDPDIPNGTPVGLRLDILAFKRKGVFVVSIHQKRTPSAPGTIIGYGSVAKITDVTFAPGNQFQALEIAAGVEKKPLQTMEGKYVNITPEQAYEDAKRAIKDPSYVQVGVDPTRHAYFFDRRTTMPIIGASEVIQIGNMILAKNPVYDSKQNFVYNVDTTIDQARSAQDEETLQSIREDVIREYAALRRRRTELVKQIKKGQVSIGLQRELTLIDELSREYKEAIEASAERRDSAEAFLARALQEFDKGNIDAEVLAVIQAAYLKAPKLLEGLLLSVKKFKGEGGAAGSFDPFERIVALYKGTSGVRNAGTFLHELAHTLEQMMTPEQRKALIDAWAAAIKKSMRKHLAPDAKDREKFQKFFDAVQRFMDNPTERNKAEAVKLLPGRDFYQFISPSEFWAVNAQSLMAARLGPAWERFKAAIRRLFEGLKKVFGFDNRYDVHQVFKQVAYGDLNRKDYSTIEDMIIDGTYEKKILKNLPDDVDDYMKKYDRPDTPYETSTPVKDALLGSAQAASQAAKDAATNPLGTASKLIGSVDRGLTAVQNELVWFGSGLDAADFSRYNGQLRDGYGRLAASAYATQAMHAGHVGTQVINLGRLIFNAKTQLFQAVKDQYSMANVVRLKAEIVKLLGEQRSANLVNTYFEAKRARSIQNEYQRVEANYQNATTPEAKSDLWEELQQIIRAYDKIPSSFLKKDPNGDIAEVDVIGPNNKKISVAIVDDTAIDEAIDFEIQVPQLRDMMTNWTAVNQNMLDNMRLAGILSKERYQKLKSIKDYVPWYRVMDDNMDIHEPTGGAVRGLSGVPRERRFGKGRTERAVDDIVDNMLHNVLLLTKSTMRNYANNRIIQNYAARDAKGRVKLAKREGPLPNGSVGVKALINGRRVTVEITDPLVAAASIGMENIDLPVNEIIGTLTNAFRRGITLDPFFQLAQIIKDAPGAAWVTGVRNPLALIGGVFESFVMALNPNDPVTQILKSYGIGGFQSLSRSPERQLKIDIGLLNKSNFARALDILDRIGDASDFAQRRAIYNRVLKETGDETQALLQANNIIDFMKRGSSRSAQFVSRYVAFATAYAQSINVLAQALAGGGLKGMSRKKAQARILKTGALLAGLSTLYAMSVAGSEEYEELDDQTRLRNIVIPGSKAIFGEAVLIPMNTSAAFLFKALPELTYNKIIRDGTETEMDATRLKKALAEAAADSLLGPNVVPSAIKPAIEVALNKNFWTGSTVIPRGLEKFESAEQYNAATSELAKTLSGLTEVGDKRLLSPIEFDHMIRGMFGTAGYLSMYASNMLAAERPDPRLRDTPGLGRFFAGPVGRKNEELFYDLKERAEKKYQTYQLLAEKRDKQDEAEKYLDKNIGLISAYEYIKDIESDFQDINDLIRQIGESSSYPGTPKEKREEITDLQKLKSDVLEGVERERKEAGL